MTNQEFIKENLKKPESEQLSLSALVEMGVLRLVSIHVKVGAEVFSWAEYYDAERMTLEEVLAAAPPAFTRAIEKHRKEKEEPGQ